MVLMFNLQEEWHEFCKCQETRQWKSGIPLYENLLKEAKIPVHLVVIFFYLLVWRLKLDI